MITNVTIISTNLNKNLLNKYSDYQVFDGSFNYEDLLHFKSPTVVDTDIFKRVNEEIDIESDSEANALKTKSNFSPHN